MQVANQSSPVIALDVLPDLMNASHRTSIDAISNAFTDISNNRMRYSVLSANFFE